MGADRQGCELLSLKDGAARQCREAWRLVHQWRIRIGTGNGRCAGVFALGRGIREEDRRRDRRRAPAGPDGAASGSLKTPKLLVAYAFDVMPPQTEEFLAKFEFVQSAPEGGRPVHLPHLVPVGEPGDRGGGEVGARAAGGGPDARKSGSEPDFPSHRHRRARSRQAARRSATRLLARHAAGLQPPRAGRHPREGGDPVSFQRFARQAPAQLSAGGRRAQPHRARVARRGIRW